MATADRRFTSNRCLARSCLLTQFRAVLAGGTFPGPVIRGCKGDRFQLNVINHLTDATMLRSTSIVRPNIYRF
jgi:FtsP/CotA-like multicopper oxidase with cupredoxin domain